MLGASRPKSTVEAAHAVEGSSALLSQTPGPVTLSERTFMLDEISPITRSLVAGVVRFDGRAGAIRYLLGTGGLKDRAEAERIVDRVMREDPSLNA